MDIPIIYEDDQLLVLNKPPGLVVDRSQTQISQTLEDILKTEFKINIDRGGIVHRLDKDTSGLILVAKTIQALENLQQQFQQRVVKKEYLALVHGFLKMGGVVVGAIARNPVNREKFMVAEEGKEAVTEYQVIENRVLPEEVKANIFADFNKVQLKKLSNMHYGQFTYLRCLPQTGRTHQIRVHLKYRGFPIVSDDKYTGRKVARLDKRWCPRQFLHATKLEFNHPESGKRLIFECGLPADLTESLCKTSLLN